MRRFVKLTSVSDGDATFVAADAVVVVSELKPSGACVSFESGWSLHVKESVVEVLKQVRREEDTLGKAARALEDLTARARSPKPLPPVAMDGEDMMPVPVEEGSLKP